MPRPSTVIHPARHTVARAYAASFATVLIWAGNAIVTKMAAGVIAPGSIAFYRWALAFLVLAPLVGRAAWRNRAAARAAWWQLAAGGLLGMVVFQCLAYTAAETTSAINIGVIQVLMPIFSTLLASVLASERLTAPRVIGAIISIAGLVYLTSRGNPIDLVRGGLHLGDALMLVAVLSNSLYGVLLRRWALPLPIWEVMFWQIAAATVMLVPIWLLGTISPITVRSLPLILYAAVLASLLAPAGWMYGIARLGAARAAMTVNLLPVMTALLAWPLVGEQLHAYHVIGGGVALFGVVLSLREGKDRPAQDGPPAAVRYGQGDVGRSRP